MTSLTWTCALVLGLAHVACGAGGHAPSASTNRPSPSPAPPAPPPDSWQACAVDADCVVVLVDGGACDLCANTFAVTASHADEVRTRYALAEPVDVCAARHNSCDAAVAVCDAGACALQVEPSQWSRQRRILHHPLPPR